MQPTDRVSNPEPAVRVHSRHAVVLGESRLHNGHAEAPGHLTARSRTYGSWVETARSQVEIDDDRENQLKGGGRGVGVPSLGRGSAAPVACHSKDELSEKPESP